MFSFVRHPIAITLAWLLTGCQTLPMFPASTAYSHPPAKAKDIASHQFSLSADQQMVGVVASVDSDEQDTLSDIARHFGLGYNEITLVNPEHDPWALADNQPVILPLQFILPDAPHHGIVLNLASMRLFYFSKEQGHRLLTYPVGVGRDGWNTPLGLTSIVGKKANPDWTVPESILREHRQLGDPLPKVIHSGPDNPLGYYAMPLGFGGYLIHGTNKPYGIGMQVSHGCVQLYPEDIEQLFDKVDVGTAVRIVHQPYLAAWHEGVLYLEAHQPLEKWASQDRQLQKEARNRLLQLAAEHMTGIDWEKVTAVFERMDGLPTPVSIGSRELTEVMARALQVERPSQLYGQPVPQAIEGNDWAILAASYPEETEAEKLTAMLNHQGPPIPARKVSKDGQFQVVAGPFKNALEVKTVARRIKLTFEIEPLPLAPGAIFLD